MDQIFVLKTIPKQHLAKDKKLYTAIMDLEVYDSFDREGLWDVLWRGRTAGSRDQNIL